MKNALFAFLGIVLLLGGVSYAARGELKEAYYELGKDPVPNITIPMEVVPDKQEKEVPLPDAFNLDVPFTPQAPYANWVLPFEEACEEASVMMAVDFLNGKRSYTKAEANQAILDIVAFEDQHFGFNIHTDADQTAELIRTYYKKDVELIENPSLEDIKRELVKGHPILVPAAGRMLKNPYFKQPGPIYHMFVVKGYNGTTLITNEPGTKRGHNYRYKWEIIEPAIRDYQDPEMREGRAVILVVKEASQTEE